jgi:hypothetical protein
MFSAVEFDLAKSCLVLCISTAATGHRLSHSTREDVEADKNHGRDWS